MYGYSPKAQEIFNKIYRQDTNLNHNVDNNKDNYKEQLFKYKYADSKIMYVCAPKVQEILTHFSTRILSKTIM